MADLTADFAVAPLSGGSDPDAVYLALRLGAGDSRADRAALAYAQSVRDDDPPLSRAIVDAVYGAWREARPHA